VVMVIKRARSCALESADPGMTFKCAAACQSIEHLASQAANRGL